MAQIELRMPKMGESIIEATILNWLKKEGDTVAVDETILEIATDKVDSEIPSPTAGVIAQILFPVDSVVPVGEIIAMIATEGEDAKIMPIAAAATVEPPHKPAMKPVMEKHASAEPLQVTLSTVVEPGLRPSQSDRFYSPLVRSIAAKENVTAAQLATIEGTGQHGRVTKHDLMHYLQNRVPVTGHSQSKHTAPKVANVPSPASHNDRVSEPSIDGSVEIVEMDRMRTLIADHMVQSKATSPHVTSFVEVDVTDMVNWRNKHKAEFNTRYGEKITYTPIFVEAVVKAIKDFPMINVSVDGKHILVKKDINIGMAVALPSGNLIVPVIKKADQLNLVGLTKQTNAIVNKARHNKLKPEDIQDGTFTLTNVGTFGNVMGTPIINQPQVAIMATGAIRKKPAVLETKHGDVIAIRQMMFLSLSYDHRVVDGMLGGTFLRRVADYLEQFDVNRTDI